MLNSVSLFVDGISSIYRFTSSTDGADVFKVLSAVDAKKIKKIKWREHYHVNMKWLIKFDDAIRVHHIYKDIWQPSIWQELVCRPDRREEAIEYDKNVVGVFRTNELVGHIPIELSSLMTKSQRITNILYEKLTEKNDTLKHFEMTLKEDEMAIKEERVVKTFVCISY